MSNPPDRRVTFTARSDSSRTTLITGYADVLGSLAGGLPPRGEDGPATGASRAAVIGHTGRGDYGHGLDVIFNDVPGVTVVALADPEESGRAKAAARCGAARQYANYREMLEKEKPQLV